MLDFDHGYDEWKNRGRLLRDRTYVLFFKLPIDSAPEYKDGFLQSLRKWFFSAKWHEVYDLVEFFANVEHLNTGWRYGAEERSENYRKSINNFLEKERSGFRFVGTNLAPITNEEEVSEVDEAANISGEFAAASNHIRTAIKHYANRKSPDFRNSIKEAISAVEACAKIISGKPKATLGDAIKVIDTTHGMHPSLKEGLLRIYGYTSSEGGIRHAMIDAENVDEIDAKFMLISCSAFCNYLISRYKPSKK